MITCIECTSAAISPSVGKFESSALILKSCFKHARTAISIANPIKNDAAIFPQGPMVGDIANMIDANNAVSKQPTI